MSDLNESINRRIARALMRHTDACEAVRLATVAAILDIIESADDRWLADHEIVREVKRGVKCAINKAKTKGKKS